MATITELSEKFMQTTAHVHRRPAIIDEIIHAKTQLHLQSEYPGREQFTEALPQSEYSPWPMASDDEE
jgi:hypothetical protein